MKVENLEEATRLVKELKKVEIYKGVVVEEKRRIDGIGRLDDNISYMNIKVDNVAIELNGYPELASDILDLLISEYTLKSTELTKQIESL